MLGSLGLCLSFHSCLHRLWKGVVAVASSLQRHRFFRTSSGMRSRNVNCQAISWWDLSVKIKPGWPCCAVQNLGSSRPPFLRGKKRQTPKGRRLIDTVSCAPPRISPMGVPSLCLEWRTVWVDHIWPAFGGDVLCDVWTNQLHRCTRPRARWGLAVSVGRWDLTELVAALLLIKAQRLRHLGEQEPSAWAPLRCLSTSQELSWDTWSSMTWGAQHPHVGGPPLRCSPSFGTFDEVEDVSYQFFCSCFKNEGVQNWWDR